MGRSAEWYSPLSDSSPIATVMNSGKVSNVNNTGFTGALVSINNPGLTTNLSFTATTDKNRTQVRCVDTLDLNSMTCTIMISGISLTVSYITNMTNSEYTSQYVCHISINFCYYYTYCLSRYEEEEL